MHVAVADYNVTLTLTHFDPSLSTSTIINQHWPTLFSVKILCQKLPNKPKICYQAPRTLGKILTRVHIKTKLPALKETSIPTV